MSTLMSRNQREGQYAGRSKGTHHRHHSTFRVVPRGFNASWLRSKKDAYLTVKSCRAGLQSIAKRLAAEGLSPTGRAVAYTPEMQDFPPKDFYTTGRLNKTEPNKQ